MATRGFLLSEVDTNSIRKRRGNIVERGAVQKRSDTQQDPFAKVKRDSFATDILSYPSDLGNAGQGHYLMFYINDQKHANVTFGNNVKIQKTKVVTVKREVIRTSQGNKQIKKTIEEDVTVPISVTESDAASDYVDKTAQDLYEK